MTETYFRKGFGLKDAIRGELEQYHSALINEMRARDHVLSVGGVTVRLAKEFGFCYGVDRAVEYAYETRRKFPQHRIFLVGEIIHNPHVNGSSLPRSRSSASPPVRRALGSIPFLASP